ncbi:hypothetical protein JCM19241_5539 [Vibrio ishigakensis]|uniref:Uncharacterized protein n=1 Tax=Vibrio ishigakensis TaxID=1481914 RepID=A0A0B8QGQ5_9VIBR|nr:hypothetical protein JCM19241_5539 [Vibrio ishigakensis]
MQHQALKQVVRFARIVTLNRPIDTEISSTTYREQRVNSKPSKPA